MTYKIIDENGEIQGELKMSEKFFTQFINQVSSVPPVEPVDCFLKTKHMLLKQLDLLAVQSTENPQYSAANADAMCKIAAALNY